VGEYESESSKYPVVCTACGVEKKVAPRALYNRTIRNCVCSRHTNEELYKKWTSLKGQIKNDPYYIERRIEVTFTSYDEFKQELWPPAGSQIKRLNPEGNFAPGNVTWA
jgi:hypothetical protein